MPALDLIWGGLMLAGVGASLAVDDSWSDDVEDGWILSKEAAVVGYAGLAGVAVVSAAVGFNRTARCREAKRALAQRLTSTKSQPPTRSMGLPRNIVERTPPSTLSRR